MEGGAGRAYAPSRQAALSRTDPQGRSREPNRRGRCAPGPPRTPRPPPLDEGQRKSVEREPRRAYSDFPFDLDQEIRGAITAAEEVAPEGKHGTLYLWSGGAGPVGGGLARGGRRA